MTLKNIYSSDKTMMVVLAFISAFPPLSTDLYIPALPQMVELFQSTPARVNLTLSLFFVFFGMILISMGTYQLFLCIGIMQVIIGSLGFLFWMSVKNKDYVVQSY